MFHYKNTKFKHQKNKTKIKAIPYPLMISQQYRLGYQFRQEQFLVFSNLPLSYLLILMLQTDTLSQVL